LILLKNRSIKLRARYGLSTGRPDRLRVVNALQRSRPVARFRCARDCIEPSGSNRGIDPTGSRQSREGSVLSDL
jgi:hypothetical protein